ncbi:MAG: tRNA (adenosine(37)-N6)-dimethylallyltransferase MiaA [Culturomica sp.]|nr:tRNA (adenosine(37)-N6)-dimethylallyltransferase MiaA [Culturomica sp.]
MKANREKKRLIVLLGPTGVGKTDLSIEIAGRLHTPVLSCDSRQLYKEMKIGTAVPTDAQLAAVPHFFIGTLSVSDYYNSWQFEQQALEKIRELHRERDDLLMTGGSMMYIDAVCRGIDDVPTVDPEIRSALMERYEAEGLEPIRKQLKELDPDFYGEVDLRNPKRVLHALEVCLTAGKPYSSLRTHTPRERDFAILKIGLYREREELYRRIDRRVEEMLEAGLEQEARALYPLRHLNALNTVGYKELFDYFDGKITYNEAVSLIKRDSRRYAKKQLSWFRRDPSIHWFHPEGKAELFALIEQRR